MALHVPPPHPDDVALRPPVPAPFPLRSPTPEHLRRRTIQTLRVVSRRLSPVLASRVRGERIDPTGVARALRRTFADLGATYVKFGQLVASAPSVFGPDISAEFRSLLDEGHPVEFKRVLAEIEKGTGRPARETFSEIDPEPIGRASVAVVHRARLRGGDEVAVKILRPGIERKIAADLAIMGWLVPRIASRVAGAQARLVRPLIDGLRAQLCEELDLRNEGAIMMHFNRLLERVELPSIAIPHVYGELSSRRVLVMEFLRGVPVDDLRSIEEHGIDPEPLVTDVVKGFFLTAVRYGIFHGDVHAGNLLLCEDGRIGVLDWGIVGRLAPEDVEHLRAIIRAALGDESAWEQVCDRIAEQIGPLIAHRLGISGEEVPKVIRTVLEPVLTRPFGEVNLSTLLLGPEELAGAGASLAGAGGRAEELPGFDGTFDRNMMLLAKQLLYFERYGQMYLQKLSLLSDREFFEALINEPAHA